MSLCGRGAWKHCPLSHKSKKAGIYVDYENQSNEAAEKRNCPFFFAILGSLSFLPLTQRHRAPNNQWFLFLIFAATLRFSAVLQTVFFIKSNQHFLFFLLLYSVSGKNLLWVKSKEMVWFLSSTVCPPSCFLYKNKSNIGVFIQWPSCIRCCLLTKGSRWKLPFQSSGNSKLNKT